MKRISVLLMVLMLAVTAQGCGSEEDVRGTITNEAEEAVMPEEEISEEDASEAEFSMGNTDGTNYESSFIGLGYQLNEGWSFYTDEQIMELNNATADMAGEEYQELMSEATLIYDMFAADAEGLNNININLEKVNPVQLLALDLSQNFEAAVPTMETAYENMGYSNFVYEVSTAEIDGKEVDTLHITVSINDVNVYQTLFAVKCNGYLANVAVTTYFEDNTAQVLDRIYWVE